LGSNQSNSTTPTRVVSACPVTTPSESSPSTPRTSRAERSRKMRLDREEHSPRTRWLRSIPRSLISTRHLPISRVGCLAHKRRRPRPYAPKRCIGTLSRKQFSRVLTNAATAVRCLSFVEMKLKSSRNPRAAAWRRKRLAAPWLEERRLVAVPSAALGAAGV
jgi:hypothetical protein